MACVYGVERRRGGTILLLADSSFEIGVILLMGFAWMEVLEKAAAASHAAKSVSKLPTSD